MSRGGTFSMGESVDEFGGGEFGEGRSRHKIDEWQAAWNVTNAIQVSILRNCHTTKNRAKRYEH